jgi:hypothetical protein
LIEKLNEKDKKTDISPGKVTRSAAGVKADHSESDNGEGREVM